MKRFKRLIAFFVLAVLLASILTVNASASSYTYSMEGYAVATPNAADVVQVIDKAYAGWGNMGIIDPSDLAVSPTGEIYIADTGNNRIVVLDSNFKFKCQIATPLMPDDSLGRIREPKGVFVDANGLVYIADTGNNQVIACDENGVVSRVITASSEDVFNADFVFKPIKVSADSRGNVYVISEGAYDGLMQFDAKDNFVGFVGANDVSVNFWDTFWKKLSTSIQRGKMVKEIPLEFKNIDIDKKGFIYTVTSKKKDASPQNGTPVRRQSALGVNILKNSTIYGKPIGDIEFNIWDNGTFQGASEFTDVSVRDFGYMCLDSNRNRIFAYSDSGDPLFVVGGYANETGKFLKPVALETYGDYIYVLDASSLSVTVFKLNEYGSLIIAAQQQYIEGDYEASKESWQKVLRFNSQLNIAYTGIGRVYYMLGEYEMAMDYAEIGGDKNTYSKAYGLLIQNFFSENLGTIIVVIAILIVLLIVGIYLKKKFFPKKEKPERPDWVKGLRYSFYIMTHPFDGFWDMVHEKRGNKTSVTILYSLWVLISVAYEGLKGFLYQPLNSEFVLVKAISISVLPVVLWCLCNWAVSTLLDGDGKPSHIIMGTAYALVPYMFTQVICLVLTNILTLEQSAFIGIISGFGLIWTGILLVASVISIHNYSLTRSVAVIVLIIFAMAVVVFLSMLVFNLIDQMRYFLIGLYKEIVINM